MLPLNGIPKLTKTVDEWDTKGAKTTLIYAGEKPPFKALLVTAVRLKVGSFEKTLPVSGSETHLNFQVPLEGKNYTVRAELLGQDGKVLSGAYYVYCTKKPEP